MKVAIMQPYFLPYIGYFQLINAVDTFVIYDDVNYIKKGWINRNNLNINGQVQMFTIALSKASQNKFINEIEICDSFEKFRKTVQRNYAKAPYFDKGMELIDRIISFENRNLSVFIASSIDIIMGYLDIKRQIIMSSALDINSDLGGEDKVIAICKELNGLTYINPIGGLELYSKDHFSKNGVALKFIKPRVVPYRQFGKEFIPNLSILDAIMHNPVEKLRSQLDSCDLI